MMFCSKCCEEREGRFCTECGVALVSSAAPATKVLPRTGRAAGWAGVASGPTSGPAAAYPLQQPDMQLQVQQPGGTNGRGYTADDPFDRPASVPAESPSQQQRGPPPAQYGGQANQAAAASAEHTVYYHATLGSVTGGIGGHGGDALVIGGAGGDADGPQMEIPKNLNLKAGDISGGRGGRAGRGNFVGGKGGAGRGPIIKWDFS